MRGDDEDETEKWNSLGKTPNVESKMQMSEE